ncbi:hypothetical protein J41TS12_25320 [Paenibacillus antibioticophila]|uniref:Uncharacterized protein n=1 Tax=Paenibacillus antibioticophila TaxID=1274374 RepID=A0A919XR08_9BACL|nr:hypothetical protein J41TS12_25320 [Paenibacillus antibioticophila]
MTSESSCLAMIGWGGRYEQQVKTEAGWNHESNALVPKWTSAFLRAFVPNSQAFKFNYRRMEEG